MNRKPIETENQDGYFACEGCRDERCHEEQDLRVDAEGVCWCEECYSYDHTWEEWEALKPFTPKHQIEISRLRAEVERLTGIIEQQKRTFLATMDSSAAAMIKLGKVVQDQEKRLTGQPDLVDSERAANEILTNEVERLKGESASINKQNEDLYDTVLAAMCAMAGMPIIAIRESSKWELSELQTEVDKHGEKLSDGIKRLQADAKLGRLVRGMPEGSELIRAKRGQIFDPGMKAWGFEFFGDSEDDEEDRNGSGDTPDEALERAGVKA